MACQEVTLRLRATNRSTQLFYNRCIDGYPLFVATDHFWVMAYLPDGSARMLDPSVKPLQVAEARDPLADAGFTSASLLSAAGGTVSVNSAVGVSQSTVDAYLNSRASALRRAWTNANASASSFVGGRSIIPQSDDDETFMHGDICLSPEFVSDWSDSRRDAFRVRATLSFGDVEFSFFLDELGARRLWLSFASSGTSYPRGVLKLNDQIVAAETVGASSSKMDFSISVTLTNANMTSSTSLVRSTDNVFVIPVGFSSGLKGGMLPVASSELAAGRARGLADSSSEMLSRTLQLAGHAWLSQRAQLLRFAEGPDAATRYDYYALGIAGCAGAPFVDFGAIFGCSLQGDGLEVSSLFASALEHAVLEQLMGNSEPAVMG